MQRAFVTGGGGFIGRRVVDRLIQAGTEVRAIARSDAPADRLRQAGCEVVIGDATDADLLAKAMAGCESVYHLAGDYRVGIGRDDQPAMLASNVTAAERVLDAAIGAGVRKIVHVSTINAFGNTGYRVVDETFVRPRPYRYVSYYDETKHLAHLAAEVRIAAGAPVIVAMPGGVYGPSDRSSLGNVLRGTASGRLRAITFGDLGMNMGHVEDVAAGIVLAGTSGRVGEKYVLGGELTTLAELVRRVAAIAGRPAPRFSTPTWALRAAAPVVGRIGPNLGELVSASAGVTYWASDAKVRAELGYAPRDLERGLTEVFGQPS
jgi:dihydroflavonol-4-reductase